MEAQHNMRIFKPTYQRGNRKVALSKWYVELRIADRVRRVPAYTDKEASREFGRKLVRLGECRRAGLPLDPTLSRWLEGLDGRTVKRLEKLELVDAGGAGALLPLAEHLTAWAAALQGTGCTAAHCCQQTDRARRIIEGCGARFFSDVKADRVRAFLGQACAGGMSARTAGAYLQAAGQFFRWLVAEGRAAGNPLASVKRPKVGAPRRERRALTSAEAGALIQAAQDGGAVRGVAGPVRAALYTLGITSGLRYNELRALEVRDLDLDGLALRVRASTAKNRRESVLPLHPAAGGALRALCAAVGPAGGPVFRTCTGHRLPAGQGARFIRHDLEAAGVPFRTAEGCADFHSLRVTFATMLARSGARPREAQELLRHADIRLTLNTYTRTDAEAQRGAIAALPIPTDLMGPGVHGIQYAYSDGVQSAILAQNGTVEGLQGAEAETAADGVNGLETALSEGSGRWYPQGDLNPCFRSESPTS